MKKLGAAQFKEKCLAILDHVSPEGIIVTKHGKPVAKIIPIRSEMAEFIGCMKGKIKIRGNILSTERRWDAQS